MYIRYVNRCDGTLIVNSLCMQVSHVIRTLKKAKIKVKKYIDQLLAIVLDNDPNMLEGMPRLQQSPSMSPDLLGVASLPEVPISYFIKSNFYLYVQ